MAAAAGRWATAHEEQLLSWDVSTDEVVNSFRLQSAGAAAHGSPMYSDLCSRAADDIREGGPVAGLVQGWEGHPILGALPLRVMGAVHALVLAGEAETLAAYYPSVGGQYDPARTWTAFRDVIESRADAIRSRLDAPVQTNEVGRCCSLLGGFLVGS